MNQLVWIWILIGLMGNLMLFTDGNRVDLHIETKDTMIEGYIYE